MEKFFEKYSVALDERNAIDFIADSFRHLKKNYSKNDADCLKDLAEIHEMIADFFEAKGLNIVNYKE